MTTLEWKTAGPKPNAFEATCGDTATYSVHFADSAADTDAEFRDHLSQVIRKAASFASLNLSGAISRIVLLWDGVYATLTVVYTNDTMERDACHVTKCRFSAIDERLNRPNLSDPAWATEQNDFTQRLQRMLEELVASHDLHNLPATVDIFFTDQDRASYGIHNISVHCLARRQAGST
ncbi:MAG TPA: hypothetical protein VM165_17250 [Planctomycetaceae bacterium]|nr:hypothetical protein [Planctomycetaceae bacterium]